ncbi:DPP IV N-terminal domain-containing protein [Chitinivibrio alkaliphilus]|uniref:TolB protein n=1 Tax=Chitinivibrio alkaliphilus ACht1 TaxID=1313304 RepID=U7D9N4_9BACT|nr:DPP IV N-terminal domain-containing protein [Chitinivibrio alkaliphilus]ERP39104.1 tolB protein [Chitinivibrio alkaliphilus ACht1]
MKENRVITSGLYALWVLLLSSVVVIAREVHVESRMLEDDAVGIAVFPFENRGDISLTENRPDEIMAANMDFSPRFRYFESVQEFDTLVFQDSLIAMYLDGYYRIENDTIDLTVRLVDAFRDDVIQQRRYRYTATGARRVAHRFSDTVYERLFGETGPFSSYIYYVDRDERGRNIFRIDYDGHNQRVVTRGELNIMPAFGVEGDLFWIGYERGKADLYAGNLRDGTRKPLFASRRVESSPSYCPSSDRVAFASSHRGSMDIYSIRRDGTGLRHLAHSPGIDIAPSWSPNGYRLAFISDRSGTPQIYTVTRDGESVERITYGGTYYDSPAWSPQGDYLAYTSRRDGRFDVFMSAADGSGEVNLTKELPGNHQYPSWSPDGAHVAFQTQHAGASNIWLIRVEDGAAVKITTSGSGGMPAWTRGN